MKYDVLIVGGGMVGAALAVSLKNTTRQVALIDAAPILADDTRLIALNYASFCFFEHLGIWPLLAPHAAPIKQVHVSQRGHFGSTRLNATEHGLDALGYVVPARYINTALYSAISDATNITLIRPASVTTLMQDTEGVTLDISSATHTKILRATLVIGADGTHSTIRDLLGIPAETLDYQQSALVTVTDLQRSHEYIAYERFQNAGAIAMLPLTGLRAATIWTASNDTINHLLQLNDAEFLSTLQTQFGYRLGRFITTSKRVVYPLKSLQARQQKQQQVLLIGNAAHTLHPIAAQGLNLALYEVSALATYLAEKSLSLDQLPDYHARQHFSSQLSHRLVHLFSTDFFMLSAARSIGMIGLDIFPAIQRQFVQKAVGKAGNTCKK